MSFEHPTLAISALALIAGMTAASNPAAAAAQNVLYSGGGTSAAKVYRQIFNCYAKPLFGSTGANTVEGATTPFPASLPTTECSTTAGDPAPPYAAPFNATAESYEILYSSVGSGKGLSAFTTGIAANLGDPSTTNSVAFTTTAYSAYPYPAFDFAGSDAALTTTQANAIGPSNGLAAIQIPAVAYPISLPFNPGTGFSYGSALTVPTGGSSKLRLSITAVCGIFTGAITNWNSTYLSATNGGVKLANQPITVYVRSDSSGASLNFSNWLVINCAHTVFPVATGFTASQTPTWPSGFQSASGSGGIASAVAANSYAIGYVSPDYVKPVSASGPVAANLVDPTGDVDPPTSASAALAIGKIEPPSASPYSAYDWGQPINNAIAEQSTTATGYTKGAYPITGFTFLDFYQCYAAASPHNPLAASDIRYFLVNFLLSGTNPAQAEVRKILGDNGFTPANGVLLGAERTKVASLISYTGSIKGTAGSAACNAYGVVGVNG